MKVRNENNSFNFKAGLTNRMKRQICSCNVQKVSAEFSRYGIPTDFKENKVIAVLDIDSEKLATFDETDKEWLEKTVKLF